MSGAVSRDAGLCADWCRSDDLPQNVQMAAEELIHLMTIMYMAIQEALDDPEGMADVRQRLSELFPALVSIGDRLLTSTVALNPGLVSFLLQVIIKLRWDETGVLPQTQVRPSHFRTHGEY